MGHGEFLNGIRVLEAADGQGYPKLFAYDPEKSACLLERLGKPLKELNYPIYQQMEMICSALEKSWQVPVCSTALPNGDDSIAWFREFISSALNRTGTNRGRNVKNS